MESHHDNKDIAAKKPSHTEAVDDLISKKEAERKAEGHEAVMQQAEGVQSEVADVISGAEAPREKVSERAGESGEKGDIRAGAAQAGDAKQQAQASVASLKKALPSHEVMVKKIRTAINIQIKQEMKKAKRLQKNMTNGSAQEYNTTIAKIRRLKETLHSLVYSTFEAIKATYFKYFNADGRRKRAE